MYRPDRWVLIEIKGDKPFLKVLAGWSGGYLNGDSWRMNSGISKVHEEPQHYIFEGVSGSRYHCSKSSYGLTALTASIFAQLPPAQTTLIQEEDVASAIDGFAASTEAKSKESL